MSYYIGDQGERVATEKRTVQTVEQAIETDDSALSTQPARAGCDASSSLIAGLNGCADIRV